MAEPAGSAEAGEASNPRVTLHQGDSTLATQEGQGRQADLTSLDPRLSTLGDMTLSGNLTLAENNQQIQNIHKPTINHNVINTQNVVSNSGNSNDQVQAQSRMEILLGKSLFVRTNVFERFLDFIKKNGIAILAGPKGSGKSFIARAILRHFENQDYSPLVIKRFEEFRIHVGRERQAILLENIFDVERKEIEEWSDSIPLMKSLATEGTCYVVITMRKEAIEKMKLALEDDDISSIPSFDLEFNSFTEDERTEMLKIHMEANGKHLLDTELKTILAIDRSGPCFPSQCKQIARDYNSGDPAPAATDRCAGQAPVPAGPSASAACSGAESYAVSPPGTLSGAESYAVSPAGKLSGAESYAVSPAGKLSGAESYAVSPPGKLSGAESYAVSPPGKLSGAGFGGNRAPSERPSPGDPRSNRVHKIDTLRPHRGLWPIKARVIKKTEIQKYGESRGKGRMFSVTLKDDSGQIQATGFGDAVDRFFDLLEVNRVFKVSHCSTGVTPEQYSNLNNRYQLLFTKNTLIERCDTDTDIQMSSSFVPIRDLAHHGAGASVDVVGVVKVCHNLSTLSTQHGCRKKKRDLEIVDMSGREIYLSLWENEAENFDGSNHPVIAVKGANLSSFGGLSLSMGRSGQLEINPDIKEAHELREWYDREGISMDFIPYSVRLTCDQVCSRTKELVHGETLDYSIKAMVTAMPGDNCFYQACENCNTKVVDLGNGFYRCKKCIREFPNFKLHMVVHSKISDVSGHLWVSCFQDSLESLLNVRAEELEDMRQNNIISFDQAFERALHKECIFRLRSKMVIFDGESRLDTVCVSATPVDNAAQPTLAAATV